MPDEPGTAGLDKSRAQTDDAHLHRDWSTSAALGLCALSLIVYVLCSESVDTFCREFARLAGKL
ncbi:MAG: hypothetical protein JSU63_04020 [Phycisphaerales bacterium]|nr:MAG: hypothetical protein JSU63_04020 [Phycisphaerales bacterium]